MYTGNPNGNGIYIREVFNRLSALLDAQGIEYTCFAYTANGLANTAHVNVIKLPFQKKAFNRAVSVHRIFWNFFILPFIARNYCLVYSFSSHGSPFIKNQVITIHDLICFEFPRQHKFQYVYARLVLPLILRSCKKVVAISDFTRQMVTRHFSIDFRKVLTIHNGGDHLKRQAPLLSMHFKTRLSELTGDRPFFLCVGATYPHKNVEAVIRAMETLGDKYRLLLTGPANNYYHKIKLQLTNGRISNVVLLDYVEDEFLQYLYAHCVANIYISLHEGFGFPPMEAAGYNKISLLSGKGALPEIYGDAACYVDPHDIPAIETALRNIASPAFDSAIYHERYTRLFSTYTWDKNVNNIYFLVLKPLLSGEA
jgi:glycosyltransferase involved in cell wall biosynthesis